jgi:hypothetical protein
MIFSCKHKKNDVTPALDIIKSQVAHVDSTVDPIYKLIPATDSTFDTTFIDRKEFNELSKEFTESPDIFRNYGGKYKEDRLYNEELGQAVFTATPLNNNMELTRQEVRIKPGPPDKITSIYLEKFKNRGDSTVIKRLTWYIDRKFQVVTIVEKDGKEDKISVVEVSWNDHEF